MIIKEVRVKNFRSILDESLPCDHLTALVGRNGAGKSSFLRALEMFYEPSAKATVEDFYAEDISQDIEVAVTFSELTDEEKELFSAYVQGDTLAVARVFSLASGTKPATYHGMKLQNNDFSSVRGAGSKTEIRSKYSELRQTGEYSSLPAAKSADEVIENLARWESEHPNECTRSRDDGQFFGFTQVGVGYLGRHTRFICVPAVRDAADDATEKKGSCVTEIMDLVVRSVWATRKEVADFRQSTQEKYKEILDPSKLTELSGLESQLTNTLKQYAPDASVSLKWAELAEINVPMPEAEIKLLEDGYESAVHRTGHGLQRAFILTMLQHLVAARGSEKPVGQTEGEEAETTPSEEPHLPSLVLAIEEPELYQHPSRQRHMASVLLDLANGSIPGVAEKTQVLYTTHAPLFVGLDRFDQIRLLRKVDGDAGKPKCTKVACADLAAVADEIWCCCGKQGEKFTDCTLRPRLQAIMTPWVNEGFFADVAVLVEGEDDRAAVIGVAKSLGHDFDSEGIAVIPCMGKNNLDRPFVIFRQLGIPTYVVWDGDHGDGEAKPEENHRLLRLVGQPEEDWPCCTGDAHACFKVNLEVTLEEEIGKETFAAMLSHAQEQLGIPKKKDALKNPAVLRHIVEESSKAGKTSATLTDIVGKIVALKPRQGAD